MNKLKKLINSNRRLFYYGIMAVIIVIIELIIFQLTYAVSESYILSTTISFIIGVILNWYGGKTLIFGKAKYKTHAEISLIFFASLIGLLIQIVIIALLVEKVGIYPLLAKMISIFVSFSWNYIFRQKYIYRE